MNKVFLKGNVGNDPKITKFDEGGLVAQFSLATTEPGFTAKDGKTVEAETTWHNIVVSRTGLAGVVEKYVKKGDPLLVEGRIRQRKYTSQSGEEKSVTEIVASDIELLTPKPKKEDAPAPEPEKRYHDDLPWE